jgi:hypothetical protein
MQRTALSVVSILWLAALLVFATCELFRPLTPFLDTVTYVQQEMP